MVYNLPAGIWYTLVANQEATFLIVENRDTHLYDTEVRPISAVELTELDAALPEWVRFACWKQEGGYLRAGAGPEPRHPFIPCPSTDPTCSPKPSLPQR